MHVHVLKNRTWMRKKTNLGTVFIFGKRMGELGLEREAKESVSLILFLILKDRQLTC